MSFNMRHVLAGRASQAYRSSGTFAVVLDHFRAFCGDQVNYVVISHVSNVTGCVAPIKEMAAITQERDGLLVLDAAQSAKDLDIDVQDLGGCSGGSRTQGALWTDGDRGAGLGRAFTATANGIPLAAGGGHLQPAGYRRVGRGDPLCRSGPR